MKEKIPEDWLEITYNDIGKFYGGGTPSTRSQEYWNGSIAWTTSKALGDSLYMKVGERTISERGLKESSTTLIPKRNLLIGTRVGVGKVVVNMVDITISQDLTGVVVNKEKCLPEFIAYQTREQRLQECFRKQKRGVTIQGVSRDDLKEFMLYIPPLLEQQKIAAILFKIQQAIEIQESIIERMQELKKSTMQHVFTYGLREEKTKETEIGRVPESWEVVPTEKVYDFTKKPRHIVYTDYGSLAFVPMDLIPNDSPQLEKFINKKPSEISSGTYFEDGDILIAKITPCFENGKQCIVTGCPNGFGIATTEVIPIKEKAGLSDKYFLFYYLLKSNVRALIAGKMEGATGRQRVPNHLIKELLIPLPSLDEQKEISKVFLTIDKKIELREAKKSALQDLFKTMLNKLMTGEIRVRDLEIDVSGM